MAVRRMANNIIEQHTLRPAHARAVVEVIIAGVFVPDEFDLRGAQMFASAGMTALREEVSDAAPRTFWQEVFNPFTGRKHSERVRGC